MAFLVLWFAFGGGNLAFVANYGEKDDGES
jgi:hypothetical protein